MADEEEFIPALNPTEFQGTVTQGVRVARGEVPDAVQGAFSDTFWGRMMMFLTQRYAEDWATLQITVIRLHALKGLIDQGLPPQFRPDSEWQLPPSVLRRAAVAQLPSKTRLFDLPSFLQSLAEPDHPQD
jgi:hypothetical protein